MPYPIASTRGKNVGLLAGTEYYQKVLGIQSANLLVYWRMNEASGSVAEDATVNNRDGAYTGVLLGEPGIGDGYTCPWFDGVNDQNNIYSTSLRDAFNGAEGTFACWYKVNDASVWTDGLFHMVVRLYVDGNNEIGLYKISNNNTFRWEYEAGGVSKIRDSTSYAVTTWLHVGLVWSSAGDYVRAYANGGQVGADMTTLGTWAGLLSSSYTRIGFSGSSLYLKGWLAHGAIWSIPLTGSEVTSLATL